ncbi:MAG: hypothetical protein AABW81_01545 [Nanoarchaeota archaeon]
MLKNIFKETVIIVVGKQFEDIADIINTKKHVNEFLIAKKLNITINQTRNLLYKLSNHGLVSSIRKKNKKKGWYTYFWKLERLKCLEFLREILRKKVEQLNHLIKSREFKDFYICERCDIEFNEENALTNDFTCRECGGVFSIKDKGKDLKDFRRELERFNRELKAVEEEIAGEKEKEGKEQAKQKKKLDKEEEKRKKDMRNKNKRNRNMKKKINQVKSVKKNKKIKHSKKTKFKKKVSKKII